MNPIVWNIVSLVAGTGLVFNTGFHKWHDHAWKALGCAMIIVSINRLAGGPL